MCYLTYKCIYDISPKGISNIPCLSIRGHNSTIGSKGIGCKLNDPIRLHNVIHIGIRDVLERKKKFAIW